MEIRGKLFKLELRVPVLYSLMMERPYLARSPTKIAIPFKKVATEFLYNV